MPLYDYKCKRCGKMIELLQKYNASEVLWSCQGDGTTDLSTFVRQCPAAKTTFKFADRSGLKK